MIGLGGFAAQAPRRAGSRLSEGLASNARRSARRPGHSANHERSARQTGRAASARTPPRWPFQKHSPSKAGVRTPPRQPFQKHTPANALPARSDCASCCAAFGGLRRASSAEAAADAAALDKASRLRRAVLTECRRSRPCWLTPSISGGAQRRQLHAVVRQLRLNDIRERLHCVSHSPYPMHRKRSDPVGMPSTVVLNWPGESVAAAMTGGVPAFPVNSLSAATAVLRQSCQFCGEEPTKRRTTVPRGTMASIRAPSMTPANLCTACPDLKLTVQTCGNVSDETCRRTSRAVSSA